MTPVATVLIGSYNNADTLPRALESILAQTLGDLEVIVVDDGSQDGTAELVEGVRDPRVRRLSLPHMGIARSLNAGLQAAHAPLVAIQDADDWSAPDRIRRQVALLHADPRVAVVGCRMHEVDGSGSPLRPRTSFTAGEVTDVLMRFNPIPNSAAALRRDAVLAAGGYDPRYHYAMDYDLWLRLAERWRIVTLDEPLATRVMSGVNVAARKERAQIGETLVMRTRAMRRRRSVRGASGVAVGALAWATPIPLKRARRRRLGQAP